MKSFSNIFFLNKWKHLCLHWTSFSGDKVLCSLICPHLFFPNGSTEAARNHAENLVFFCANANTFSLSFSIYQLVAWPIDCKCAAFGSGVPMVARHRTYLDGPTEQTKIVFCIFDRVPFCTLCTLSMYLLYTLAFILWHFTSELASPVPQGSDGQLHCSLLIAAFSMPLVRCVPEEIPQITTYAPRCFFGVGFHK